ncbi:MAG: class I tRNA ligase family protein, partial [Erysipelotrichaceae bacterium]|nr:class I tRNA ligase family protein [Erysipelotrichaceae bacterium]
TNPRSPSGKFTKETDIMDVWFDSGSSWNELEARGYEYPCDLYFEGSDQYRGWFNSSLIVSVATNGKAPYRSVLSHGYVCDSKGEAMHKSVGNVVNPLDIIAKFGADILRLWAASEDFRADMRIGDSNLKQVSDQYRKVRNTFRFMLGNISDFEGDPVPYDELEPIDRFMMVSLNDMLEKVRNAYENYDFVLASSTMTNYMTNELSSYYCDYAKDILYCDGKNSLRRRQVQTVLIKATDTLVKLWSPILCFTCEEVYSYCRKEKDSVHYTLFPEVETFADGDEIRNSFKRLHSIRDDAFKALEEARQAKVIGKSLEAHVLLHLEAEDRKLLEDNFGDKVNQWLIVSKVSYTDETLEKYEVCEVGIRKADGVVCPRCWNITESTNEEGLCDRCAEVMKTLQ